MNATSLPLLAILIGTTLTQESSLPAQTAKSDTGIFPDKNLEAAVRKFVFEKRDNDKPILESDVANLSTVAANGLQIKDLTGLEKCRALASLDLARNNIADLRPLKDLANIQFLNLAANQIEDISPLAGVKALQYIELSGNRVKDIRPLAGLTNLASVYLGTNQIADVTPLFGLPKVSSLYLEYNQIANINGIDKLASLGTLSLSGNELSDVKPLDGLKNLYFLFLERNKITDLTAVYEMCQKDNEGSRRFAPYLNLFVSGNPLAGSSKKQLSKLKEIGVRVTD